MKNNFYQVEIGGLAGLILGYLALTSISFLSPLINEKVSVMFVLAIIIYFIIMLNPKCPLIFNNTAFLYFTAALIAPNEFFVDFWTIIIVFICGSVLTNTVSLKLFKIFLIWKIPVQKCTGIFYQYLSGKSWRASGDNAYFFHNYSASHDFLYHRADLFSLC